jgi:hypothetical protein
MIANTKQLLRKPLLRHGHHSRTQRSIQSCWYHLAAHFRWWPRLHLCLCSVRGQNAPSGHPGTEVASWYPAPYSSRDGLGSLGAALVLFYCAMVWHRLSVGGFCWTAGSSYGGGGVWYWTEGDEWRVMKPRRVFCSKLDKSNGTGLLLKYGGSDRLVFLRYLSLKLLA